MDFFLWSRAAVGQLSSSRNTASNCRWAEVRTSSTALSKRPRQ
jgi:hypothetical protein